MSRIAARPESPDPFAELSALLGRQIEVLAVFGEKQVPLGDLTGAALGVDLLLLPRGQPVRLVALSVAIGEGTAVEVEGRIALRIDHLRPVAEIAAELGGVLRGDGSTEL